MNAEESAPAEYEGKLKHVDRDLELHFIREFATGGEVLWDGPLRTMLMQSKRAYLQAGAGIVADSDPASEFQESMNKAQAVLRAVQTARSGG